MIYGATTDTAEPRSLHDWKLKKDMTELPQSRPPEEATAVSHLITKS